MIQTVVWYMMKIFYKQLAIIGQLPPGPCIVYSNHNNMYIDGLIINTTTRRALAPIVAKSAWDHPFTGWFLKSLHGIPLLRPQDVAKMGPGKIIQIDQSCVVVGLDTKFTELRVNTFLVIHGLTFKIRQIVSETQLFVEKYQKVNLKKASNYYITDAKLQYHQIYKNCWNSLERGKSLIIFPQGMSHDNMEQLPFKAGIAFLLLGSDRQQLENLSAVPVGINYVNQHCFRSSQVVQVGDQYKPSQRLKQLFKTNKQAAISKVLPELEKRLKQLTFQSKIFQQSEDLVFATELYQFGQGKKITDDPDQRLKQVRRVSGLFDQLVTQKVELEEIKSGVHDLLAKQRQLGINLSDSPPNSTIVAFLLILIQMLKLLPLKILALPGSLAYGFVNPIIERKIQAKRLGYAKQYSHKHQALDTVAFQKISHFILYYTVLTFIYSVMAGFSSFYLCRLQILSSIIISMAFPIVIGLYWLIYVKIYDYSKQYSRKIKQLSKMILKPVEYEIYIKNKASLSKIIVSKLSVVDKRGENDQ